MSSNKDASFERELVKSVSRERDVSPRDGVQSWDGNQWPIGSILSEVKQLNTLGKLIKEHGGTPAPFEGAGGGEVSQAANFRKEDPLINLEQIHDAAPDIDLQCLYRGRQCFGYTPVSEEVQKKAIAAFADRGVKVFRVFDMMNDPTNLEAGFRAIKQYRESHPDKKGIKIEGAISYISEPADKGPRVWELKDYADYAVKLVQMGADEIAIKNYAGVGQQEMPALVKAISTALKESVPVNLHMHGENVKILADVLDAGASKVDVAYGPLSGGPSHPDAVEVLKEQMRRKNFDVDGEYKNRFDNHPIVRQMREIEKTVAAELERTGLEPKRPPVIAQEDLEHYRMAGGAMGEAWSNRSSKADLQSWRHALAVNIKKYGLKEEDLPPLPALPDPEKFASKESFRKEYEPMLPAFRRDVHRMILGAGPELWEKAGRFNTVTPGALILTTQAQQIVQNRATGVPASMMDYTEPYMDVVAGRYGENKGAEKLDEAKKFRNAVLIFRALRRINEAAPEESGFVNGLLDNIKQSGVPLKIEEQKTQAGGTIRKVKLDDPDLERNLAAVDIGRFRNAVETARDETSWFQRDVSMARQFARKKLREDMLQAATPGKFADPTEGHGAGRAIVREIETKQGINIEEARAAGARLSSREDLELLAMMLRKKGKFGEPDDAIMYRFVEDAVKKSRAPMQAAVENQKVVATIGRSA